MANHENEFITRQTQKRLISDITYIYKNPLNDQGIYYIHDDSNMLKGYAMIIGPKKTPYEDGFYFFEFSFPYDYPVNPPKVTFLNQDSKIRFNPNLYRNGKVCLSILNTWKGEGWTSCQTIHSILVTLVSILNETPLLNEPGITETHRDYNNYNLCIEYENMNLSIVNILLNQTKQYPLPFIRFAEEHILKYKDDILEKIQRLCVKYPEPMKIHIPIYRMDSTIYYCNLLNKMNKLFDKLESDNDNE